MHAKNRDRRFERRTAVWLACLAAALTLAAPTAETTETDVCRVEVLVDGRPLSEYAARGTTYVEARRGREDRRHEILEVMGLPEDRDPLAQPRGAGLLIGEGSSLDTLDHVLGGLHYAPSAGLRSIE